MMMWEGIDKRKFPRVNYKCLIKVAENGHDEAFAAYTQNIGAGGICVLLDKSVELFKSAVLEITLPDSRDPVKCKVRLFGSLEEGIIVIRTSRNMIQG